MARPKPDEAVVREQLLSTAESLLSHHGAGKVTITDIAAACGMSQSNAYRYFPSKTSLMGALAGRWFTELEERMTEIAESEGAPADRLRELLLSHFQIKRARYDADPALFATYLELAKDYPELVSAHIRRIHDVVIRLAEAQAKANGRHPADARRTATAFLDAILLVRDPAYILTEQAALSDARVEALVDFALGALDQA